MNTLLHQQRTVGEEVGVVGEHPVNEEEKKKKNILTDRKHHSQRFISALSVCSRKTKTNKSFKKTNCMCGKIRLFMFRVKENEGSSVIWDIPSGFFNHEGTAWVL